MPVDDKLANGQVPYQDFSCTINAFIRTRIYATEQSHTFLCGVLP